MKKYYGLKFPELPSASEDLKIQLARTMFFNPDLGCDSVKNLLNSSDRLEKIFLAYSKLDCSVKEIEQTEEEDVDELTLLERIIRKTQYWIIEFSFPTKEELYELAEHHGIHLEFLLYNVMPAVWSADLTSERILDFLRKYSSLLSLEYIDEILDLYNEAT